ncbi:hypothetical protein QQS21_007719 [Conoideocrella luteorostrata]|uniref:Heterokaryon incompatibility domain-containing protein n=1 Tax=Conoideocrella luteorostrata TaxID=1105319 RepID=A0AAJ0CMY9_9HYPO|nr:hypothetical protein QQS21_007719 [Conoideocrella luteorostrata]
MSPLRVAIIRQEQRAEIQVSRNCHGGPYVELRVPEGMRNVHRVIFRTVSHDQGYSNERHLHGTYDGSYTWFVVSVITPGGHDRVARRLLQYNVHASAALKRHEISWSADDDGSQDVDPSGRAWVWAIRGGDSIQIMPRAQWPGWINYVREAEIEAHCSHDGMIDLPLIPPCNQFLDSSALEIRLVRLDPGEGDDPISVELRHAKLPGAHGRDSPSVQYEALSYCWGDVRDRRDIMLTKVAGPDRGVASKHVFSVTSSLFSALVRIRPPPGLPARYFWVDAICINQDDIDERTSQVALMRQIYRHASRVVVWLGDGDEGMRKAIQHINEQFAALNTASSSEDIDLVALHGPLIGGDGAYYFIDSWVLFEYLWIRRTWVVQEIFNSKTAVFCCGSDTIYWRSLLRVHKCFLLFDLSARTAEKALMPPIFETLLGSKEMARGDVPSAEMGILDVLLQGLDLDATDPRDKIFAMLQFGLETQHFDQLPSTLLPDYQRPLREVFALFTKWWIVESRSLRILSAIQALEGRTWQRTYWGTPPPPRPSDLASWSWGYRGHSNWAIGLLGIAPDCPYRAASSTEPDTATIQRFSSPSELALAGFPIDRIDSITPYPYLANCTHNASSLDQNSHDRDLHSAFVALFDPLNITGKWTYQLWSKHSGTYALASAEDPSKVADHGAAHRGFAHRTGGALECLSSCVFRTRSGQRGLCPAGARLGDLVAVLLGGQVPYILWETKEDGWISGQWEFVGECYLQGYMDGRAVEERDKEEASPLEVFVLV